MANSGSNPFDTSDDINPFGADDGPGLEHYDPFNSDAKPPSRPSSPAAAPSTVLDFHDTPYAGSSMDNPFPESSAAPSFDESQFVVDIPLGAQPIEPTIGLDEDMEEVEEEEEEEEDDEAGVFSLAFYQKMFDVDTIQVLDRIFRSCIPFRKNFFEAVGRRPDLYGAVWISALLVFVLASSGNFANFISSKINHVPWSYEFNKLPFGALAVYLYIALMPLLLWGALAWIDDFDLSLLQAYCLYGYAMFPFVIAGMVCTAPFEPVKYAAIGTACLISTIHIILSLWDILSLRRLVQLITIVCIIAGQVAMSLAFALYFFKYVKSKV